MLSSGDMMTHTRSNCQIILENIHKSRIFHCLSFCLRTRPFPLLSFSLLVPDCRSVWRETLFFNFGIVYISRCHFCSSYVCMKAVLRLVKFNCLNLQVAPLRANAGHSNVGVFRQGLFGERSGPKTLGLRRWLKVGLLILSSKKYYTAFKVCYLIGSNHDVIYAKTKFTWTRSVMESYQILYATA